jgi:hypothetical protein
VPEEARFLLRSGSFSLVAGTIYWFLSGEPAGTLLFFGLGLGALTVCALLVRELRRDGRSLPGPAWRWWLLPDPAAESGTTDETGRLPGHTLVPLTVGAGVALGALGLVFGPWLFAAALAPIFFGLRGWLREASAEYRAVEDRG